MARGKTASSCRLNICLVPFRAPVPSCNMSTAPSADTKGSFQGNKSTILSFTQRDSESHCPLWLLSQHTAKRWGRSFCRLRMFELIPVRRSGRSRAGRGWEDFLRRGSDPRAQLGELRWWWLVCQESSGRKQDSGCGLDLPVEALSLDLQAPELVLDKVSQRLPHLQLRRSEKEHWQISHVANNQSGCQQWCRRCATNC